MFWFNKRKKKDYPKILKQYEYLKNAILDIFDEDEGYTNLIDNNTSINKKYFLDKFGLDLDDNLDVIRLNWECENRVSPKAHKNISTYSSEEDSSMPSYYGLKVYGGIINSDGEYTPTYNGFKPLHETKVGYGSAFDNDFFKSQP